MNRQDAINSLQDAFERNISILETALKTSDGTEGSVFVWPEHWLGVQFSISQGKSRVGSVADATVASTANARKLTFTNGRGERAVLMNRRKALRSALAHARQTYADVMPKI
jgi:hypothetical protein